MKNDLRKLSTWKAIIEETYETFVYGLKELEEEDYKNSIIYFWVDVSQPEHNIWIYEDEEEELTTAGGEILDEEFRNSQNTLSGAEVTRCVEAYLPIAVMKACNEQLFDKIMEEESMKVFFATSMTDYVEIATVKKGKASSFDLEAEIGKIKLLNTSG